MIEQAVRERRVVWIRYRTEFRNQANLTEREVEIYDYDDEYIDAFCRLRRERRSFRIDRILTAAIRDERYEIDLDVSDGVDRSGWANRQQEWRTQQARRLRRTP